MMLPMIKKSTRGGWGHMGTGLSVNGHTRTRPGALISVNEEMWPYPSPSAPERNPLPDNRPKDEHFGRYTPARCRGVG